MKNQGFKSGFVAIVGMPNVGKSSLINTIVGQKIAIISDKPQTTRNKILAIYTTDEEQIVFTDTPGIHKPHNKLGEFMVSEAKHTVKDTDIVVFMVDATRKIQEMERKIAADVKATGAPCILVINKIDLVQKEKLLPLIADYSSMTDFDAVVPISAKNNDGVDLLLNDIREFLEEGPKFYYDDMITDQPEKQIAAEIIREKMLRTLSREIPHGSAVVIEEFKEEEDLLSIRAEIYCEKESHKGIIVGKGGEMLKRIGSYAREDLEAFFGMKVYLNLWVKVKEKWRDSDFNLNNFGFNPKDLD